MSLRADWVTEIFTKLSLIYGQAFLRRWQDLDLNTVKSDWAHELSGFANHPEAIAWALQNLPPERPPTVLEFRALARRAPMAEVPRLEYEAAGKARIEAELAKLGPAARSKPARTSGNKQWAHAILARHAAGGKVTRTVLTMARAALASKVIPHEDEAA